MSEDDAERTESEIKQALSNFEVTDKQRDEARDRAESRNSGSGSVVVKPQLCGKYCSGCPHGPYAWLVSDDGWKYLGAVGEGSGDAKTSTDKQEASESSGMESRTLRGSADPEDLLDAPLATSVEDLEEGDIIATDMRGGKRGKFNNKFKVVGVDENAGELTVENETGRETTFEYDSDSGRWMENEVRFGQVANLTSSETGTETVDDYFDDLAEDARTKMNNGITSSDNMSHEKSLQISINGGREETVRIDRVLDGDDEVTVLEDLDPLSERIVESEIEEMEESYVDADDVQMQSYKDTFRRGNMNGVFRGVPDNAIVDDISGEDARDIVADEMGFDADEITGIVAANEYENGDYNIRYKVDDDIVSESYTVDSYHGHADDPVVGYEDDSDLSSESGSAIALTNVKETQYGPKARVEIDYDDKDDLKDLDWESAHPDWNGNSWSVDADADSLQYVREEMEGKGFDVRLSKEAKKQMEEGSD